MQEGGLRRAENLRGLPDARGVLAKGRKLARIAQCRRGACREQKNWQMTAYDFRMKSIRKSTAPSTPKLVTSNVRS